MKNMLWTGGWDSTFRLLQSVLEDRVKVTPIYLIDEERRSVGVELATIQKIKEAVFAVSPDARNYINPTQYYSISDIPRSPAISNGFERIRDKAYIGSQYDWLARFCEWQLLEGLELCIHRDDKAHTIVAALIRADGEAALDPKFSDTDEYEVFKYFSFPILNLSKKEMADISRQRGWDTIMSMTWFCHRPLMGQPCGMCNPCLYTIDEGLAWRIPPSRRALSRLLPYAYGLKRYAGRVKKLTA